MAGEYLRFCGHQPAEAAQQVRAACNADEGIEIRDLQAALEIGDRDICQYAGIDPQGIERISRECAAGEHGKAAQPQSLRTADGCSGDWIVVAPRWTGAGVEEDADHGQIEFSPGPSSAIGPPGPVGPTIIPVRDEVPPARMKGYVEGGVRLARHLEHQVDRAVHAIEVDTEVRKPVFKADREHTMRALAHRLCT